MGHDGALSADDVLVAELRSGVDATFALVVDAWSGSMLRLARSFVSTDASAEEVVQEAWLAVVQGVDRFEGRSSLKTWVYRILVNTAKKRGIKEHRTVPFATLLPEDEGPAVDPGRFRPPGDRYPGHWAVGAQPRPWSEPEDAAERAEVARLLAAAVATLPPRHRTVLTLRDVDGYSADEVCALLDISAGNQRVILHRARATVRARLEQYFQR
ncbi:RNA polymerase subunit sigma-24 [Nocardia sp. MH4]|uniref:RNA polymerase sigma factor n=1 Tax=Nocardia sp. MH4 TaxID=1768677 RepID=UPI001C4EE78D|nr:sigma-70 family RNA polymerase sigma factor [Nocardia sp. MH4]MBW0270726.1 RNA polymerase subunit sigma-24 [Nocardia sp. MH4]